MSLNHKMQHLAHGSIFGKGKGIIVCDVHAMSDGMGSLAARAFRALHILSGNDEIARTRTKGKKFWLVIFAAGAWHPRLLDRLADAGA